MVKKVHKREFKSRVVLEAIKGRETIAVLAQKYGVLNCPPMSRPKIGKMKGVLGSHTTASYKYFA